MSTQTILVVGENIGRTKQRVLTMRRLGYEVTVLSPVPDDLKPGINEHFSFLDRVRNKLGFPADRAQLNKRLLDRLDLPMHGKLKSNTNKNGSVSVRCPYDLLWIEKSLTIKPSTLKIIKQNFPALKIAWFSEDDMFARHNQSFYFKKSLPLYDIVFTTKSYNCNPNELPAMGAKKVIFVDKSYDPTLHKPVTLSAEDINKYQADVAFIGTFEQDRFEKMRMLAEKGVIVRVWGNGWKSYRNTHPNLHIENKPIYEDEFIKALQATKINLCFLRKINRDLQTDRTMEIPACNAFMLAERTNEHLRLFAENKEAAYFDITHFNELYEKVRYFLSHEDERKMIAHNGYKRCIQSHYSHDDRIRQMLGEIDVLSKNHYTS